MNRPLESSRSGASACREKVSGDEERNREGGDDKERTRGSGDDDKIRGGSNVGDDEDQIWKTEGNDELK